MRLPLADQVSGQAVADVTEVFGLLSDPGRLRILLRLHEGEANVSDLSSRTGMSHSATSHALRLLRAHEVVRVRRTGRMAFYELADDHVRGLISAALQHQQHAQITHPERLRVTNKVVAAEPPALRSSAAGPAARGEA